MVSLARRFHLGPHAPLSKSASRPWNILSAVTPFCSNPETSQPFDASSFTEALWTDTASAQFHLNREPRLRISFRVNLVLATFSKESGMPSVAKDRIRRTSRGVHAGTNHRPSRWIISRIRLAVRAKQHTNLKFDVCLDFLLLLRRSQARARFYIQEIMKDDEKRKMMNNHDK